MINRNLFGSAFKIATINKSVSIGQSGKVLGTNEESSRATQGDLVRDTQ